MKLITLFNIARSLIGSNFKDKILPFKLTLVTTKRCHSRCQNCLIWKETPSNELSLSEYSQIAKSFPQLLWLDLTGGEPTDHYNLTGVLKAFVDNCSRLSLVHFPTNGINTAKILKTTKDILKIYSRDLVITVSLDGPPNVHDSLRGIPRNFEKAIQTYQSLKKIPQIKVYFGMTLYSNNAELIEQTIASIKTHIPDYSSNDFHINLSHQSTHYYGNTHQRQQVIPYSLVKQFQKKKGFIGSPFELIEWMYLRLAKKYMNFQKSPIACESLRSTVYISEKGDLHPCSIWDNSLGNLRDYDYNSQKILSTEKAQTLRQQVKELKCPQCWTPCEAYLSLSKNPLKNLITCFLA